MLVGFVLVLHARPDAEDILDGENDNREKFEVLKKLAVAGRETIDGLKYDRDDIQYDQCRQKEAEHPASVVFW